MADRSIPLRRIGDVLRAADLLTELRGSEDLAVSGVSQDSRSVSPGDLFLAWKGTATDAHDYVPQAEATGASALVVEHPVASELPQLVVADGRRAAALAAGAVLGAPWENLTAVGITGTNGKTTTALLARWILDGAAATRPAVAVGTLGMVDADGVRPGTQGLTSPGPVQVAVWLWELASGGVRAVVMEASSHALDQHRLDAVPFRIGAFTTLGRDHLDYHGDEAAYFGAKARLVELVDPTGTLVVNGDEPAWADLEPAGRAVRTFSVGGDGDVSATALELGPAGSSFVLQADGAHVPVTLPLLGRFNVENALAAAAIALAAGVDLDRVEERLGTVPQIPGRLEVVHDGDVTVLVDFAHTPDALETVLATLRPLAAGRLLVVFGAGGDRDRAKRPAMARAVARAADVVVLTSDNPRTEDPEAILDDLAHGLEGVPHHREVDRAEAIGWALDAARPGDTVLLAGKGHETYQVVGTETRPFDEPALVRAHFGGTA